MPSAAVRVVDAWWVIATIRGAEKRWPEEGTALIKHREMDFTISGVVMREGRAEAEETFLGCLPVADRRDVVKVMSGRLIEVEEREPPPLGEEE